MVLFCSVLEFGPVPTSPTPLLQGAPVRLLRPVGRASGPPTVEMVGEIRIVLGRRRRHEPTLLKRRRRAHVRTAAHNNNNKTTTKSSSAFCCFVVEKKITTAHGRRTLLIRPSYIPYKSDTTQHTGSDRKRIRIRFTVQELSSQGTGKTGRDRRRTTARGSGEIPAPNVRDTALRVT